MDQRSTVGSGRPLAVSSRPTSSSSSSPGNPLLEATTVPRWMSAPCAAACDRRGEEARSRCPGTSTTAAPCLSAATSDFAPEDINRLLPDLQ